MAESTGPGPSGSVQLSRWETLDRELVAACRVFDVFRKHCRHPGRNTQHDFYVIDSPDWVNVVAHTADDRLVLVNQFRYGAEEFSLEIPGGIIERGEDPVAAGCRELLEETGYGGGRAQLLGRIRPNPAVQNNWCHLVWVEGVTLQSALAWDEHEEIETHVLPVAEVMERARSGSIQHALTLNALFLFEPHWQRGRSARGV